MDSASQPMHVSEIHHAVERELGRSVNYRSVKSSLSGGFPDDKPAVRADGIRRISARVIAGRSGKAGVANRRSVTAAAAIRRGAVPK
jgi:hypothetical protein